MFQKTQIIEPNTENAFLEHYMWLHDAEITSHTFSSDKSSLSMSLNRLCIIDSKTDFLRYTDTQATLVLMGLSDINIYGELVNYGINHFEIMDDFCFELHTNDGGITGKFTKCTITPKYNTERII